MGNEQRRVRAYAAGVVAARSGEQVSACPFGPTSRHSRTWWLRGYLTGCIRAGLPRPSDVADQLDV
jgi:ribosome modulation factor